TIDAFCAGVARRMPLTSGLGAMPAIVEDARALYRGAARRAFADAASQDLRSAWLTLLGHLDNRVEAVLELLADMLARRDQWLKHVVAQPAGGDLRAKIEEALRQEIALALTHAAAVLPRELASHLRTLARYANANLADPGDVRFAALAAADDFPSSEPDSCAAWKGVCAPVLTQQDEWRVSFGG